MFLWDNFVWPGTFAFETPVQGIRLGKLRKMEAMFCLPLLWPGNVSDSGLEPKISTGEH